MTMPMVVLVCYSGDYADGDPDEDHGSGNDDVDGANDGGWNDDDGDKFSIMRVGMMMVYDDGGDSGEGYSDDDDAADDDHDNE